MDMLQISSCEHWKDASPALLRSCLVEVVDDIPLEDLPDILRDVLPNEFVLSNTTISNDRMALSLLSFVEYSVVRRCIFSAVQHSYCNAQDREEAHAQVDAQLARMILSKNEDMQYRAMMLGCARSVKGRTLVIPKTNTIREQNIVYFISLCTEDAQRRKSLLEAGLENDSLRAIALLEISTQQEEWMNFIRSWSPKSLSPLEKSLVHHILHGEQE